MNKPHIEEIIVVEGRYDKNTVSQIVDATVLELGGFAVFNNTQKLSLLRRIAKEKGIILFTDPDGAGFVIRNHIKGAITDGRVLQAYAPDVFGKEKRKRKGGREGKLGVEGMTREVILDALRHAGATFDGEEKADRGEPITKADMMERGLVGDNSAEKRRELIRTLELPEHLSANALLEVLNLLYTRDEFIRLEF